jgi:hypothetical protein
MLFELLSYMSYMYMRKHHKRTIQSGGATPDGKIPFPLMKKGERFIRWRGQRKIYQMQRTEAWFQGEHE